MLTIDGSQGEGGGQILRTSLGLSMLTGKPFRITRIRANRDKPGLMRQHLTAVLSAAKVCAARVEGAAVGSSQLTFTPGPVTAGEYTFTISTTGSSTLVFQAFLPALLTAAAPSTLHLEGGTHNIYAPPLDFLEKSFLAIVNRMGPTVKIAASRLGFYPAGGGRWTATIAPAPSLSPVHLDQAGETTHRQCTAIIAGLPGEIAVRELAILRNAFDWPEESFQVRQLPDDQGPGNVVMIELGSAHVREVVTAFGQRGVRAEAVAEQCLQEARKFITANVPVGEHLADQLLIPLAIAGGGSYLTTDLTDHTRTNIDVVKMFLDVEIATEQVGKKQWKVKVTKDA